MLRSVSMSDILCEIERRGAFGVAVYPWNSDAALAAAEKALPKPSGDTPERISKCLSCEAESCFNCYDTNAQAARYRKRRMIRAQTIEVTLKNQ